MATESQRSPNKKHPSATMRFHAFLIIVVALNHVIHGEETNPSLQEANHENATNSSVIAEKREARSDLGGQGESEENPPPFWANRGRSLHLNGERLRRHEPFFVEEPQWLVVEEPAPIPEEDVHHEDCEESRNRRTSRLNGVDEAFWPSRGRRSGYKRPTGHEDAVRGVQDLAGIVNMFHSPKGNFFNTKDSSKSHGEHRRLANMPSMEEPFWAARGRSLFLEPRNHRSGLMESLEEPFWAARGRRSGNSERATSSTAFSGKKPLETAYGRRSDDPRGKRPESFSGEEPFWAARGRRFEDSQKVRRSQLFSGEEPFWAARGRRFDDSQKIRRSQLFSGEEPFWAARGRRMEAGVQDSISGKIPSQSTYNRLVEAGNPLKQAGNEISEIARGRRSPYQRDNHIQFSSSEEPFWAARGKRGLLESVSNEEPFWAARGKKQYPQMNNWWPFQEAAATLAEDNSEDESFWTALENKLLARRSVYDMIPM